MDCVLTGDRGSWHLRVQWANEVVSSEEFSTVEAAVSKASALWLAYRTEGWTEE